MIHRSERVARAMRLLQLSNGQETFIGIYSKNRPEWVIVEQATYAFSNILVPLYDTLGFEALSHIVAQTNIGMIFCDTELKAAGHSYFSLA